MISEKPRALIKHTIVTYLQVKQQQLYICLIYMHMYHIFENKLHTDDLFIL